MISPFRILFSLIDMTNRQYDRLLIVSVIVRLTTPSDNESSFASSIDQHTDSRAIGSDKPNKDDR